jgi:hypothetical protein
LEDARFIEAVSGDWCLEICIYESVQLVMRERWDFERERERERERVLVDKVE